MSFCHIFPKEFPLEPELGCFLPVHFLDTLCFVNMNAFKSLPCCFSSVLCTSVILWVLSFNPILYAGNFHWADARVSQFFGCILIDISCVGQVVVASDAHCCVHQCSISSTVQVFISPDEPPLIVLGFCVFSYLYLGLIYKKVINLWCVPLYLTPSEKLCLYQQDHTCKTFSRHNKQ